MNHLGLPQAALGDTPMSRQLVAAPRVLEQKQFGVPMVPHSSDLPKKFVRSRRRRLSRPTFPLFQASPHRSEGDRCKDEQDADDVHDRR